MADEKNHLRATTILEILGKPKEHVESTMRMYVDRIKEDGNYVVLKEDIAEVKEVKDDKGGEPFFSTYAELDIIFKGPAPLIGFFFYYIPSSL